MFKYIPTNTYTNILLPRAYNFLHNVNISYTPFLSRTIDEIYLQNNMVVRLHIIDRSKDVLLEPYKDIDINLNILHNNKLYIEEQMFISLNNDNDIDINYILNKNREPRMRYIIKSSNMERINLLFPKINENIVN